jgi:hypothetical protein
MCFTIIFLKKLGYYSNENLDDYIQRFYQTLDDNREVLTEKTIYLMPYDQTKLVVELSNS